MRRAVALAALLVAPLLAAPGEAVTSEYVVAVVAWGIRDGERYDPYLTQRDDYNGVTPPESSCAAFFVEALCPVGRRMPAGQRYTYEVTVTDRDGRPAVGERLFLDLGYDFDVEDWASGTTDANGTFRMTTPPMRDGVDVVELRVEFPAPSEEQMWSFYWRSAGRIEDGGVLRVLPEGEWLDVEIRPLRTADVLIRFDTEAGDFQDTPVRVFFGEANFEARGRSWGLAATRIRDEPGDVDVRAAVAAASVALRRDAAEVEPVEYWMGDSWAQIEGTFGLGEYVVRATLGAVGMAGEAKLGLTVTADPDAYELRVVGRGPFGANATVLRSGAGVHAADFGGLHHGHARAAATVPAGPSLVVAAGGVANLAEAQWTLARDDERRSERLREASRTVWRNAECAGEWTLDVQTTRPGATRPQAVLVVAPGMPTSGWVREGYGMPADCRLADA